ncbi:MAG: PatB family C-S lyase [Clostridia bacterium]|nr:PatB family C-S lyase [Clostridia bacterium]
MKYNFDELINRVGTQCIKYDCAKTFNPELSDDFIPMWIADMDFAIPSVILQSMKAVLDQRILGYSFGLSQEYYQSVINWMKTRHQIEVKKEEIVTSCGVVTAMKQAVLHLTNVGDKVLIQTPSYRPFYNSINDNGRIAIFNRLIYKSGKYEIDWQDFEEKAKQCKLFFLCSPHNPTGRLWTKDELQKMSEICFENGVFIFCDEIHHDIVRNGNKVVSLKSLHQTNPLLITATAPSKTFNLAGNNHSNIIVNDTALAQKWRDSRACGSSSLMSTEACKTAYEQCGDWLDQLNAYLDENVEFCKEYFRQNLPQAVVCDCQATYLLWVDLTAYSTDNSFLRTKISKAGVYLEFGDEFVENGDGFARINVACPKSVLKTALERIVSALK